MERSEPISSALSLVCFSLFAVGAVCTDTPVLAASPPVSSTPVKKAQVGSRHVTGSTNFERFRHEKDFWKLLHDRQVLKQMHVAMGNDIEHYLDWTFNSTDIERTGDDLFSTGRMIGGAGVTSFFDINMRTGHVCMGYLDSDTMRIYGATSKRRLPKPVAAFLASDNDHKDVSFEKPNPKPVPSFHATEPDKNLNTKIATGTYEREPTRFTNATFFVQVLPSGRIKFSGTANLGGRMGQVEGEAPLVDNHAIFKDPNSNPSDPTYIELIFRGKDLLVEGNDSGFCGCGVELTGKFTKISDAEPDFK